MTLGTTPTQGDLFGSTTQFCAGRVREDSIYAVLHREGFHLFPDWAVSRISDSDLPVFTRL